MKLFGKLVALGSLALAASLLAPVPQAHASTSIGISVGFGPPAPLYAPIPVGRAGYVWTRGYWRWDGYRYIWVRGRWYPRREGYVYVRPHWVHNGGRWFFRGARWHPHHVYRRGVRHGYHRGYHSGYERGRRIEHHRDVRHDRREHRRHHEEHSHHGMRYTPVHGHGHHGH